MPTAFQYVRNSDHQAEQIAVIDSLICQAFGWEEDVDLAIGFDALAYIGIGVLTRVGGFEVTKENLDKYLEIKREELKDDPTRLADIDACEPHWRRFLYEEYTFRAWYERK
jgi:hypothetical protein